MRYIICVEGRESVPGQYIHPGALTWKEDVRIPLSYDFGFQDPPLGIATDIRREEDGVTITAEIDFFEKSQEEAMEDDEVPKSISIYTSGIAWHQYKHLMYLTAGIIRGVAVVPHYFWPLRP